MHGKPPEPAGLNSKILNVLQNPSGPHQRTRRSGAAKAANTASGEAAKTLAVLNVAVTSIPPFFVLQQMILPVFTP
jgi:hypothetical protein